MRPPRQGLDPLPTDFHRAPPSAHREWGYTARSNAAVIGARSPSAHRESGGTLKSLGRDRRRSGQPPPPGAHPRLPHGSLPRRSLGEAAPVTPERRYARHGEPPAPRGS